MRRRLGFILVWLGAGVIGFHAGCESALTPTAPGSGSNSGSSGGNDSVGDVIVDGDGADRPSGQPLPDDATIRARVRNEASRRADVTIRFIRDDLIVHLSFVRVMSGTATTVVSPEAASMVEISGIDDSGRALGARLYLFGVDFDATTPAEFVVSDPDDEPDDPVPVDPVPTAPTIVVTEPARDITLSLGALVTARWTDSAEAPGAVVRVFLRPVGAESAGEWIAMGPAVGAGLDGINDELTFVLQGIEPGMYEVLATIDDGTSTMTSIAPGRVEVVRDESNVAPTIEILVPTATQQLGSDGLLHVRWTDADPDDNATIRFHLAPADAGVGSFELGPPIAEDPDGESGDEAFLPVSGVLPGLYDLVATIDDGALTGRDAVEAAVRIVPDPQNVPPSLVMTEPADDGSGEVHVRIGGFIDVCWEDSDPDDNARIAIYLDPGTGIASLDGNEFLLAAAISEDDDGVADCIALGVTAAIPEGKYRVFGVITDGQVVVSSAAPAIVFVSKSDDGGDGGGGDGDPQQARRITVLKPATDVLTRLGDTVSVEVQFTGIAANTPVRFLLTSEDEGGERLRVDVTPSDPVVLSSPSTFVIRLPSATSVIPNTWWPRRFKLTAEAVVDQSRLTSDAPGAIWIRQEVQILRTKMIDYFCFDPQRSSPVDGGFVGIEVEWFGGGFTDDPGKLPAVLRDAGAADSIRFWLTLDGVVPADGMDDRTHRAVASATGSPRVVNVLRVDYPTMIGIDLGSDPNNPPPNLESELDAGEYAMVAESQSPFFGRVISASGNQGVEVCFPLPAP